MNRFILAAALAVATNSLALAQESGVTGCQPTPVTFIWIEEPHTVVQQRIERCIHPVTGEGSPAGAQMCRMNTQGVAEIAASGRGFPIAISDGTIMPESPRLFVFGQPLQFTAPTPPTLRSSSPNWTFICAS